MASSPGLGLLPAFTTAEGELTTTASTPASTILFVSLSADIELTLFFNSSAATSLAALIANTIGSTPSANRRFWVQSGIGVFSGTILNAVASTHDWHVPCEFPSGQLLGMKLAGLPG